MSVILEEDILGKSIIKKIKLLQAQNGLWHVSVTMLMTTERTDINSTAACGHFGSVWFFGFGIVVCSSGVSVNLVLAQRPLDLFLSPSMNIKLSKETHSYSQETDTMTRRS